MLQTIYLFLKHENRKKKSFPGTHINSKSDFPNVPLHSSDYHVSYTMVISGRQWQTTADVNNQLLPRKWNSLFLNQSQTQNYVENYIEKYMGSYIVI